MSKYDMMGLEMYDSSYDLGSYLTPELVKEHLMAGVSGGVGIALVSTILGKINKPDMIESDMTWRRVKDGLAIVIGVLGGRLMYDRNRSAAMGFVGGVAGLGIADLLASFVNEPGAEPTIRTQFSGGNLSGADLAMLEAAVATAAPAWRPELSGTVAQTTQLSAPVVSTTELGAYAPYLS
jgi:hypothetical protein